MLTELRVIEDCEGEKKNNLNMFCERRRDFNVGLSMTADQKGNS